MKCRMLETLLQFLLLLPVLIFFLFKYYFNHWKRKGIPDVKPDILDPVWYSDSSNLHYYRHVYRQLEGEKFGGCYIRFTPKIVVRDPDIIKQILLKDFDYFHNRNDTMFDENEPITMHLFSAPGLLWRALRTELTPTFTSRKMKYMFSLIQECANEMTEVLKTEYNLNNTVDVKEYSTRYTIEVITSCAFGLKPNSIQTRQSTFEKMAKRIFLSTVIKKFLFWTRSAFPRLKYLFKLKYIDKSATQFFFKLVQDTIDYRKNNKVERNDFLQLLIKMKEEEKKENNATYKFDMNIELMTAQCFLFFVAGFDTSSSVLNFTLLELAKNPQIQKKVHDELDEHLEKSNFQITYEMVTSMKYLHQVVSETMRMYPVLAYLNRCCMRRYPIPNSKLFIEKGTEVIIPITGLHHDPQYFPNPEIFNPDRFTEKEIAKRNRYVYLPFGDGPRNCIGSRFGLLSVKLGLINLLKDFNFDVSDRTVDPLEFVSHKVITTTTHPILLRGSKR